MSKLLKLKAWLTLEEAAGHLSDVLGEPVSVADIYRLALDKHLILSVDFVNHAQVRKGKWVKTKNIQFKLIENDVLSGKKLETPYQIPANCEFYVSNDDWIALDDPIVSIEGVWDLAMVGAEVLDIEHYFQQMTSGVEVTLVAIDGVFVQRGDVICQVLEKFSDYHTTDSPKASVQRIKSGMDSLISESEDFADKAQQLKEETGKSLSEWLEEYSEVVKDEPVEKTLHAGDYFPAGGLPNDCALVVRTNEITRFIQSLEENPVAEKPLTSKERNSLLVLIGALCKQVDIDPNQRGVAGSLVAMTEELGAPLTDDTVRKILKQIDGAVSDRTK